MAFNGPTIDLTDEDLENHVETVDLTQDGLEESSPARVPEEDNNDADSDAESDDTDVEETLVVYCSRPAQTNITQWANYSRVYSVSIFDDAMTLRPGHCISLADESEFFFIRELWLSKMLRLKTSRRDPLSILFGGSEFLLQLPKS